MGLTEELESTNRAIADAKAGLETQITERCAASVAYAMEIIATETERKPVGEFLEWTVGENEDGLVTARYTELPSQDAQHRATIYLTLEKNRQGHHPYSFVIAYELMEYDCFGTIKSNLVAFVPEMESYAHGLRAVPNVVKFLTDPSAGDDELSNMKEALDDLDIMHHLVQARAQEVYREHFDPEGMKDRMRLRPVGEGHRQSDGLLTNVKSSPGESPWNL